MIEHSVRWVSDTRLKRVGKYLVPEVVIDGQFSYKLRHRESGWNATGSFDLPDSDMGDYRRDEK